MPDGAETPRPRRGRKYDQVIDGSRQVFMADGFEGASVDDIARVAGVSKPTLYSYFADKRLLFMEVARLECARQANMAADSIDTTRPPRDVLTEAAGRMIDIATSDFGRQMFRIAAAECAASPPSALPSTTPAPRQPAPALSPISARPWPAASSPSRPRPCRRPVPRARQGRHHRTHPLRPRGQMSAADRERTVAGAWTCSWRGMGGGVIGIWLEKCYPPKSKRRERYLSIKHSSAAPHSFLRWSQERCPSTSSAS